MDCFSVDCIAKLQKKTRASFFFPKFIFQEQSHIFKSKVDGEKTQKYVKKTSQLKKGSIKAAPSCNVLVLFLGFHTLGMT